jgi:hypothetical protein
MDVLKGVEKRTGGKDGDEKRGNEGMVEDLWRSCVDIGDEYRDSC